MANNSVPVFFGAKASVTPLTKPSAMDVTFAYSNASGNTDYINAVRTASNVSAFNAQLASAGIGASELLPNRYSMSSFEYDMHSVLVPPYTPFNVPVTVEGYQGVGSPPNVTEAVTYMYTSYADTIPTNVVLRFEGDGELPESYGFPLLSDLGKGISYRVYLSGTDGSTYSKYSVRNELSPNKNVVGSIGTSTPPINAVSIEPTSTAKTWLTSSELSSYEWSDARNVAAMGSNDKDETGAIYALASSNRSHATLVSNLRTQWPRTTDSWPSGQTPFGSTVNGAYRAAAGIERVIISCSLSEAGSDVAIAGTYGIGNGPVGADYNLDNQGPDTSADNNTNFEELDVLMQDNSYRQRLVFIDTDTISCSDTATFISNGTIPGGYALIGVVFPDSVNATVIYGPADLSTASLSSIVAVPNVINTKITAAGIRSGWGSASKTHTGHYAVSTNGGVFSQSRLNENLPLAFQTLGKAIGEYLYS